MAQWWGLGLFAQFLVMVAAVPVSADTIRLRADDWCPFNCSEAKKGYGVEVAEQIFAAAGHQIQYQLAPWSRSLEDCLRGEIDAVIGAAPVDSPDLVFGAEPIGQWDSTFVVKVGNPWRYDGPESLGQVKLAAIIGYIYMEPVGEYVEANKKNKARVTLVGGTQPFDQSLKMVAAGRVDAAMESRAVLDYKLREMGLTDSLAIAGGTRSGPIYIAFSPKHAKARDYARILDDGIRALRADGRLKAILDKYGVRDWK
ncbi:MAG: substrate-binding periplasmic protein [Magnetospirillum sp.]